MFTALRGRFRSKTSTAPSAPVAESRRTDAATQAQLDTLKWYLGSLSEEARAEYIAAAQDLKAAVDETGVQDFRACYRGRPPGDDSVPDSVRSLEELRSLARMIRTSIKPDARDVAAE